MQCQQTLFLKIVTQERLNKKQLARHTRNFQ